MMGRARNVDRCVYGNGWVDSSRVRAGECAVLSVFVLWKANPQ